MIPSVLLREWHTGWTSHIRVVIISAKWMQGVDIGVVGIGCTHLLLEHQPHQPQPLCNPVVKILSIPNCKMQNKKTQGIPPQMGSDTGISLGYRAWAGLITKTDASCHWNLLPIPKWKVQNKNLQGIPPQKRSDTGISLGFGALRLGLYLHYSPTTGPTKRP